MTNSLPPLLLLPGLLCDHELWTHQVQNLTDVAVPQVMNLMRDNTMEALAARVLSEAPPQFALAGISMGGYVAQEIMRQAPERVLRLALCDTSAQPETEATTEGRQALVALAQNGRFKGVTPRLMPTIVHRSHLDKPEVTQPIMDMAERMGRDVFISQQQAIMGRADSRPSLGAIKVPTLVMVGRDDLRTPLSHAEEIAAGIPQARLAIVEECGHLPPLEQPEIATNLLREWLQA